jgi:hypothetical protein
VSERKGEKIGWIGGWCGGFLWVVILSVVFLIQGKGWEGLSGVLICLIAGLSIYQSLPWRHPDRPYWRLFILPYGLFLLSIVWAVWAFGGIQETGFNIWNLLWLIPAFLPFGTMGRRKWNDFLPKKNK